jgi:hypothetical protein
MRKRKRPLEAERAPFVDSLRVAQTVSTMDPLSVPEKELGSDGAVTHSRPSAPLDAADGFGFETPEGKKNGGDGRESSRADNGGNSADANTEQAGDEIQRREDADDDRNLE